MQYLFQTNAIGSQQTQSINNSGLSINQSNISLNQPSFSLENNGLLANFSS